MKKLDVGKSVKDIKKRLSVLFLIMVVLQVSFNSFGFSVAAASNAQNGIGFYVKAELPENQHDSKSSYFDLRVIPGQMQMIHVEVTNTSDQELAFHAKINDATTNSVGSVEYQFESIRDTSLLYSLKEIAKIETPDFVVPANSRYRIPIALKIPKEEFDGELIGGVIITKINPLDSGQASMSINNIFSYVIGLRLTETDIPVLPELELVDVSAQTVNYRSTIVHSIRNIHPRLLNDAKMKIEIFKIGQKEPHWIHSLDLLKMAPSSFMHYNMYVDGSTVQPGKYISKVKVTSPEGEWFFEKEFEITAAEVNSFKDVVNNNDIRSNDRINYMLLFVGILILLILIYLIYKIIKQLKKTEPDKSDNEL